jgi:N6-adenosine-specific RNA methylase IME4
MKQLKFPNKLYKVIYADPPWKYSSRKYQDNGRNFLKLEKQYNTMKIQDIMKLPVKQISDEDCACISANSSLTQAN